MCELGYDEFNAKAKEFNEETAELKEDLERCLAAKTNVPVWLRCDAERGKWSGLALQYFCPRLYKITAKCQKDAGDNWYQGCRDEMQEMMSCADDAMKRLYLYNLEHKKAAVLREPSKDPTI
eukprot:Hpha_TRINITY_DN32289_c0_g1::TRINITY_DN32289_c0_g1_i1::g.155202::m.155202